MGAGGAQPNISKEKIVATVCALPPAQEQLRIVAKVDELMRLCDRLEEQLVKSKRVGDRWLRSVVGRVFAGDEELVEV